MQQTTSETAPPPVPTVDHCPSSPPPTFSSPPSPSSPPNGGDSSSDDENKQLALSKIPEKKTIEPNQTCVVRFIHDIQTCSVNGFLFTFLPRLEGKWSGELHETRPPLLCMSSEQQQLRTSDLVMSDVSVISTKVQYHAQGYWILRETTAKVDGAARILRLMLTPVAHGVLSVKILESDRTELSGCVLTFVETRPFGMQLSGNHCKTGNLLLLQIVTITSKGVLERVQLRYSGGELRHTCLSRERRVD